MKIAASFSLLALLAPAAAAAQVGNDCASAETIVGETVLSMQSLQNTTSGFMGGGVCSALAANFVRDRFFQWSATTPGDYTFLARSPYTDNFDCQLALYSGVGCAATCLDAADMPNTNHAILHLRDVDPSEDFLLQFGGEFSSSFTVYPALWIIRVIGDTCDKAEPIAGSGVHEFRAYAHSASGFTGVQACNGPAAPVVQDKFYRWTALEDGDYRFDTFDSPVDAWIKVYDGPDCGASCIGVGAPTPFGDSGSTRIAGVQAGDELLIQVITDWDLRFSGEQVLNIHRDLCGAPDAFEPNDTTQTAFPLQNGSYTDLSVRRQFDDNDFFSFRLEPGESVFAELSQSVGGASQLGAYDSSGNRFSVHPSGLGGPYFTNTFPWASNFFIGVSARSSSFGRCAGYDLDFRVAPDPCSLTVDDAMGENDTCAEALPLGPGVYPDQFVSMIDDDYYSVTVAPGSTFRATISGSDATLYLRLIEECGGSTLAYRTGDGIQWTNTGPVSEDIILEVQYTPPGQYVNRCTRYDLALSGGVPIGSPYCTPTVANSTGGFPVLTAEGSTTATDNNLTLFCDQLPANSFGYYVGSQTQGFAVQPGGSQGTLCLGGAVARFLEQVGQSSNGQLIRTLDLANFPEPNLFQTTVVAGQTWNFQLWYRDFVAGMPASNFSAGLTIVYQ